MFKHFGKQAQKFTFHIEVHDVVLPLMRGVAKGDFIKVSFERGSKSTETAEVAISNISSTGDMRIEFEETLSLGVTLYKGRGQDDSYLEKTGTLTVLQRKKGTSKDEGKNAYKKIGTVPLELHQMSDLDKESMSLNLLWCVKDGAIVNTTITAASGGAGDDDASSVASGASSVRNSIVTKKAADTGTKKQSKVRDIDDDDDWKPKKNNGAGTFDDDERIPWGDPFEDSSDQLDNAVTSSVPTSGSKQQISAAVTSATKSKNKPVIQEAPTPLPENLSREAQAWAKELEELRAENHALREREANLTIITTKADFFANEAKRLEELLQELKQERDAILSQKTEADAEFKGVISENEVLVQEMIATKLSIVDLSTDLDVTTRDCSKLRQSLGPGQMPNGQGGPRPGPNSQQPPRGQVQQPPRGQPQTGPRPGGPNQQQQSRASSQAGGGQPRSSGNGSQQLQQNASNSAPRRNY